MLKVRWWQWWAGKGGRLEGIEWVGCGVTLHWENVISTGERNFTSYQLPVALAVSKRETSRT